MAAVRDLYETDFFEWTRETAERIRRGEFSSIDLQALAEEIEDLGKHERREVHSRIRTILLHLLKWQYQPGYRDQFGERSWRETLMTQRQDLEDLLEDSPRLRRFLPSTPDQVYPRAVQLAARQTGLPVTTFPPACPWTIGQILDLGSYPEA